MGGVDSKPGNSQIPVSEEGVREKGMRRLGGRSGHFCLGGGQGPLKQGTACTRCIKDVLTGEGEQREPARQQKE